jgi:hypothetical protein
MKRLLMLAALFIIQAAGAQTAPTPPTAVKAVVGGSVSGPTITAVSPKLPLSGSLFTCTNGTSPCLQVSGTGFVKGATTVLWNGTALTSYYKSATSVYAQVPPSDTAIGSVVSLTVSSGGVVSAPFAYTVNNPWIQYLSAVDYNNCVPAGAPSATIKLYSNQAAFNAVTQAYWMGVAIPTTDIDSSYLTITVPAAALSTPGAYTVIVKNPEPVSSWTNSQSVTVWTGGKLQIVTTTLPTGYPGVDYSTLLDATCGYPPYTWAVTAGSLPPGLTLSMLPGSQVEAILSGQVPAGTTPATWNFTITVTDSGGSVYSAKVGGRR